MCLSLTQHTTLLEALQIKHILIRVRKGEFREVHTIPIDSQPILKLTRHRAPFRGSAIVPTQSHSFFPELREGAYPVYTDTEAALFTLSYLGELRFPHSDEYVFDPEGFG